MGGVSNRKILCFLLATSRSMTRHSLRMQSSMHHYGSRSQYPELTFMHDIKLSQQTFRIILGFLSNQNGLSAVPSYQGTIIATALMPIYQLYYGNSTEINFMINKLESIPPFNISWKVSIALL